MCLVTYEKQTTNKERTTYTEVAGGGYSDQAIASVSWNIVVGDPTTASYPEITFSFTGAAGNIYGYYVVQSTSGRLMWAERFTNGPFNIQNSGDEIRVTPQITAE